MKIHALITSLVLGSTSVAMADPVTVSASAELTFGTRGSAPVVVRDHRTPVSTGTWYEPAPERTRYNPWRRGYYNQPRSMLIGSNLHFSGDGRTFIPVGLDKGRFSTLRLDGYAGASLIQQVAIEFEHGQVQVVRNLNRVLDGNRPLMIDLDGNHRSIVRVVVYGKPYYPYGDQYAQYRGNPRLMAPSFSLTAL